jgi:O-antigen/teichoic acid export membrane protein
MRTRPSFWRLRQRPKRGKRIPKPQTWSRAIRGLGGRAAIITASRLLNQALVLISPIVLVRLLSVEDFGRYREFLLYATVLLNLSALGINSSLLRFVPDRPELKWHYVAQSAALTFATSVLITGSAWLLDIALGGKVLGEFAIAAVLYVLLFSNLDFWEFLWLAEKRKYAVLSYTTARVVARMTTVIAAAALSADVAVIVWSLVGLEAVRLAISLIAWRKRSQKTQADTSGTWREQLSYCVPFAGSMVTAALNRSMGSLFIAKLLGPIALAHYAIGTYVQPVITVVRNSISDVLLPEMVSRERQGEADRLGLFRRTTVVTAIFLVGAGVVLGRYAEILVTTLFPEEYRPAVALFQVFLLVFLRDSLDFGVPMRAINRTSAIMHGNLLAMAINATLLVALLPTMGLIGAVWAFVISKFAEGYYLGIQLAKAYEMRFRDIAAWGDLAKVLLAAAIAALVLYGDFWTEHLGVFGVIAGALVFVLAFGVLLVVLGVPEITKLLHQVRSRWPIEVGK